MSRGAHLENARAFRDQARDHPGLTRCERAVARALARFLERPFDGRPSAAAVYYEISAIVRSLEKAGTPYGERQIRRGLDGLENKGLISRPDSKTRTRIGKAIADGTGKTRIWIELRLLAERQEPIPGTVTPGTSLVSVAGLSPVTKSVSPVTSPVSVADREPLKVGPNPRSTGGNQLELDEQRLRLIAAATEDDDAERGGGLARLFANLRGSA